MAIGKASDFQVYQEYMQLRISEVLTQNGDALGAGLGNAINISTLAKRGEYEQKAFFKTLSSLVSRRDTTSVSAATDQALTQAELVSVKLNRTIGPVAQTRDAFRKILGQYSQTEFSGIIGEQAAVAMQLDMMNSGLLAARAALVTGSSTLYTIPSAGTMSTTALLSGLETMGDRADRVVAWVMHSHVYFDLVQEQLAANIDGISNFNVRTGTPVTLNRPVFITDSSSLVVSSGSPPTNTYYTLGLVPGAITLENTEEEEVVIDDVTGLDNLVVRIQGEFAYNVGLKGFEWDVANGGANPTSTAVGTGSNWDAVATSYKDYAGIVIASG